MKHRISKIAKECNIGLESLNAFLKSKGYVNDFGPNIIISEELYKLIIVEFKESKDLMEKSKRIKHTPLLDIENRSNSKRICEFVTRLLILEKSHLRLKPSIHWYPIYNERKVTSLMVDHYKSLLAEITQYIKEEIQLLTQIEIESNALHSSLLEISGKLITLFQKFHLTHISFNRLILLENEKGDIFDLLEEIAGEFEKYIHEINEQTVELIIGAKVFTYADKYDQTIKVIFGSTAEAQFEIDLNTQIIGRTSGKLRDHKQDIDDEEVIMRALENGNGDLYGY